MDKQLLSALSHRLAGHLQCSVLTAKAFVALLVKELKLSENLQSSDAQKVKDTVAQVYAVYMQNKVAFDALLQNSVRRSSIYTDVLNNTTA
jgi:hypothetical protein